MTIDAVSEMTNNALCDHQGIPAGVAGIPGCWSGHQYFPDGDFHSGADTDLCTEDRCHLFVSGGYRSLDDEHDGGVHGAIVVKFQPVCT